MKRIKIENDGWRLFNGLLGSLEFVNGVSVRPPTPLELRRIGANIKVVGIDDELQVGPSVAMVNSRHISASIETSFKTEPTVEKTDDVYTEDSLNEIADKGGIKELRKVAAEFDVKGVSISDMIAAILETQAKKA